MLPLADRCLQRSLLRRDGDRHWPSLAAPPISLPRASPADRLVAAFPYPTELEHVISVGGQTAPGCAPRRTGPGHDCFAGLLAAIGRLVTTRTVGQPR